MKKYTEICTSIDSTDYFWDHTCFKLKALYNCKAVNTDVAPLICSKVAKQDVYNKEYAFSISLANRYDNKTSEITIPYYRVPIYFTDTREIRKAYKKHMCTNSEFMKALKYVFSDLGVKKIKYQDVDQKHYVVEEFA